MSRQSRRYKHDYLMHHLEKGIDPPGFIIKWINNSKGRGVVAQKVIPKGEFLFEYRGKRLYEEPKNLEYVFELTHDMKKIWIDASEENGSVGRLVNDDHKNPNAYVTKMVINNKPHIVFWARQDIGLGEEITFNYDGSAKKTFDWRESEVKSIESSEIQSSGDEWKAEDEDSEQSVEGSDKNVSDSKFKSKILNAWLKDQQETAKKTNVQECQTKPKLTTTKPLTLRATRLRDSSTSRPHRPTKRLRKREPRKLNYDGSAKKIFDWRKSEGKSIESSEIQSSGEEWKAEDEDSEQSGEGCEKSVTDSKFKSKRLNAWLKDQHKIATKTNVQDCPTKPTLTATKPLTLRATRPRDSSTPRPHRPTKRLRKDEPRKLIKKISDNDSKIRSVSDDDDDDDKAAPALLHTPDINNDSNSGEEPTAETHQKKQCHVCGKYMLNLNRHLKDVHDIKQPDENKGKDSKGYITYFCPICGKIVKRLTDHLTRTHEIKDRKKRKDIQSKAVPVPTGLCEKTTERTPKPAETVKRKQQLMEPREGVGVEEQFENLQLLPVAVDLQKEEDHQQTEDYSENKKETGTFRDEPWLLQFLTWLSTKSVNKKEKDARQHSSQVFKIWNSLRSESRRRLHDITNSSKIEDWFSNQPTKAPGTLKSYITSLNLFMDFLIINTTNTYLRGQCGAVKSLTQRLSQSFKKAVGERFVQVQTEALETMPTSDEIKSFFESEPVREAKEILKKKTWGNEQLTSSMFANARDYLISTLLLSNGQRSGGVLGITYNAIERAKITEKGATITVTQHKTGYASPAYIGADAVLFQELKNYVTLSKHVPNFVERDRDDSVFISWPQDDEPPRTLDRTRGVQELWNKILHRKISATLLRKTTATYMRERHPEMANRVATHMNHLRSTADKYYIMKQHRDSAIDVSQTISETMFQNPGVPDPVSLTGTCEECVLEESVVETITYRQTAMEMLEPCHTRETYHEQTTRILIDIEECQFPEYKVSWPEEETQTISSNLCTPHSEIEPTSPVSPRSPPNKRPRISVIECNDETIHVSDYTQPLIDHSYCVPPNDLQCTFFEEKPGDSVDSEIDNQQTAEPENRRGSETMYTCEVIEPIDCVVVTVDNSRDSDEDNTDEDNTSIITAISSHGRRSFLKNDADAPDEDNTSIITAISSHGHRSFLKEEADAPDEDNTSIITAISLHGRRSFLKEEADAPDEDNTSIITAISSHGRRPFLKEDAEAPDEDNTSIITAISSHRRRSFLKEEADAPDEDNTSIITAISSHGRRSFLKEEADALIRLCERIIVTKTGSIKNIISTLKSTEEGQRLLQIFQSRFGIKTNQKLKDRVKTEIKRRK